MGMEAAKKKALLAAAAKDVSDIEEDGKTQAAHKAAWHRWHVHTPHRWAPAAAVKKAALAAAAAKKKALMEAAKKKALLAAAAKDVSDIEEDSKTQAAHKAAWHRWHVHHRHHPAAAVKKAALAA